ncbi:MAG TPA: anaerobic ribonucleoside-triphosphate reductase [Nitrososphaeraceae archaeon]|nr:anaerobic ribonucleoside-triphosphate reductase [Nitrososphaeraceae archaeon]
MEQLSHDYSLHTENKRYGILESASKRVRMIFSVMASPNRIDILRILNSKGPLTYSELKSLAGFKSKKESGKFAYHLRKLLRQSLVALNKGERRYTITNLGKLVLSLARQIEERSIVESGKMYVRTTHNSIEEFNSHKIIQSIVREGGMPLEQAQKITEEVENKIYKFQAAYLTSSLVRETVNSVLIEHGYEEYRSRMTRLGMPSSDLLDLINNAEGIANGIEGIINNVSMSVFSEHLLFNSLPKDISDMHLGGELNISNPGAWGIVPDVAFLNINESSEGLQNLNGKFFNVSRIRFDEKSKFAAALQLLLGLMSREASSEVVLEGISDFLLNDTLNHEVIASSFAKSLIASSGSSSYSEGRPAFTILLPRSTLDKKTLEALLEGYTKYTDITPLPRAGLALYYSEDSNMLEEDSQTISSVVRSGGRIAIMQNGTRTSNGIRKSLDGKDARSVASLQSLSINLPRLAYQSNKDETYFRAKLALTIKPALEAMFIRKKNILNAIRKGLYPVMGSASFEHFGTTNIILNLTGAKESVYDILGYNHDSAGDDVLRKVLKTSGDVALDHGRQMDSDLVGVSMIDDDSSTRFSTLDSEKYGRTLLSSGAESAKHYSQGIIVNGKELLLQPQKALEECKSIDSLLRGGLSTSIDLTNITAQDELNKIIAASSGLAFFRPFVRSQICRGCSRRYVGSDVKKCETCGSVYLRVR